MDRLALDRWASPWLRNQHVVRYRWASQYATGARVLDAACGTGYGSSLLRDGGARQVTSIDVSLEAFRAARRLGNGNTFHFVRANATRLPLADGRYDLYACFETIEHVDRDEALLREAKRVLRPGGVFLCSTPNRELLSPGNTIHDRPANPYHVREYSIAEFRRLLESTFSSVTLYGQTWFSETHRRRLESVGRRSNLYAVRLHQLRNICGLPWEHEERHSPRLLDGDGVPEVVIALCR